MIILPTWLYDQAVERFGQDWVDKNGYVRNELVTDPEFEYSAGGEVQANTGFTLPVHYVSRDVIEGNSVNVLDVIRESLRAEGKDS